MKNTKSAHIIWQNYNLDLEDWREGLIENREINGLPIDVDDATLYEDMYVLNSHYLEDEQMNLNIIVEGRIVAIADIGLWDGRRMGYKLYDHNISDCLTFFSDCEFAEFWVDRYDFKCEQSHHDGCNLATFREIKPNLTSDQVDYFLWKIYKGKATQRDITRYTRSLAPYIKDVYGWK